MKMLKRLVDDYHVTMFIGVMFIISGLITGATEVIHLHTGFKIKLFHSMIFLGLFNCCMSVVFMIVGVRNIEAGEIAATQDNKHGGEAVSVDQRLASLEARLAEVEQWKNKGGK